MITKPSKSAGEFVRRIWTLCNILRGDSVSYHEYITELTYLLFLKIAEETGREADLPEGFRWRDLVSYDGPDLLTFYRYMLTFLGGHATSPIIRDIYAFPTTVFSHHENLRDVVEGLDKLDWHAVTADAMGDMYEGLLSKNSQDARSGAGQYFTPRPLVDCMVELMQPSAGEVIQDPACGTGGFLIAAKQIAENNGGYPRRRSAALRVFSDIGRVRDRIEGKTYPDDPVIARISCRIAIDWRESGTWCGLRIFIFSAGMVHSAVSKSISSHRAWRSSPGRTKTCGASCSAHFVMPWPS